MLKKPAQSYGNFFYLTSFHISILPLVPNGKKGSTSPLNASFTGLYSPHKTILKRFTPSFIPQLLIFFSKFVA
jgi:hypothetical protein